jgi:hypothetical protein
VKRDTTIQISEFVPNDQIAACIPNGLGESTNAQYKVQNPTNMPKRTPILVNGFRTG